MNGRRTRVCNALASLALACLAALAPAARVGAAKGGLKKSDAQKLIAAYSLLELGKSAVTIKEITPGETAATVTAGVRVGFHFERDAKGSLRATEMRVGDRQWEDLDLLSLAFDADSLTRARAALDNFAAELDALTLAKKQRDDEKKKSERRDDKNSRGMNQAGLNEGDQNGAAKKQKRKKQSSQADSDQSDHNVAKPDQRVTKSDQKAAGKDQPELVRGALRVKSPESALSLMGKSAFVEAEIEAAFDVVREGGKWRIAAVRIAGEKLPDFDAVARALDIEKGRAARADLEALASALEAFRRERGFYVVADNEIVLVDLLNPRYTPRFIRVDPWHHAYGYVGTRDAYTIRSDGADGKPHTPDDIERRGGR
ncbi:MAG: Type secretion system protein [Acidobacteriota bacterium]|nr:Type secretion system protein [Acidobacteriota bacterium]